MVDVVVAVGVGAVVVVVVVGDVVGVEVVGGAEVNYWYVLVSFKQV